MPTRVFATAGDARATVTWVAPASNGGSPITSYTVSSSVADEPTCTWSSGPLTCTITGLTNGVSYYFKVTAKNNSGSGPPSNPSNVVTPTGEPPPPTAVSATAGDQQATVTCSPPVSNGGAAITSYTATASPGGAHASAPSCPITVTGLSDGTTYTFTVTATSSLGTSGPSGPSNNVTLVDNQPPSAPSGLAGALSHGALTLSWHASTDNVGVDYYRVYLNGKSILSIAGNTTRATFHAFATHGNSVYRVSAFDAAGNQSGMSGSIVARPTPYPKNAPKDAPRWAWQLLAWQQHHKGTRPKTPKHLPAWYAAWKHWRQVPFQLVS
jgi:fibronectin type 3 domain-containing protein